MHMIITELYANSSFFAQGSPDLKAAREVANYLGTIHHEFHFTVQVQLNKSVGGSQIVVLSYMKETKSK